MSKRRDAYLALDLGNSSTRMKISVDGEDGSSRLTSRIKTITNRYGYLRESDLGLLESEDYTEQNSRVFRYDDDIVCIGDICTNERGSMAVKPTSIDKKYLSKYSQYALRLALLQAYQDIEEITGEDIETLDVLWHIGVCIPAVDMERGEELMKDMVRSIDKIEFLMPEITKKINIDPDVVVKAEGLCAVIATLFENKALYRQGMKDIASKKILFIDFGEETTDMGIVANKRQNYESLYSILMGGNTISQKLRVALGKKYDGINLGDEAVRELSVTGIMKLGAKEFDVSELVNDTRKEVARAVCNEIKQTLNRLNININEIECILMCGGGAVVDEYSTDTLRPIGYYIEKEVHDMLRYAEFIKMPDVKETTKRSDGSVTSKIVPLNPRYLNVMGVGVFIEPKRK